MHRCQNPGHVVRNAGRVDGGGRPGQRGHPACPTYRIPVDDRYEALLEELAKLREVDRRRVVAERAQKNLSRYFAPKLAAFLARRDEALGEVRR